MMPAATGSMASGQPMRRDDQMLYLMIKPGPQQAAAMNSLRRKHGLARSYAVGRMHITLVLFGDIRMIASENLQRIRHAVASLQADPFDVVLNRIKGNALVGNHMRALKHYQRSLVAQLTACGIDLPDYSFEPHASLSYEAWQNRNIPVAPITWRIDRLLLINSIYGKGHELLDSWSLEPRQGSLF